MQPRTIPGFDEIRRKPNVTLQLAADFPLATAALASSENQAAKYWFHLQKGQNLVLWDEITEVRPLRILNIRSLWLIRQSGEKTIMPWTSLERHSDLKAAVETSAPANHPIRKYLSFLRRI